MSPAYLNPVTDQRHSVLAALRALTDVDVTEVTAASNGSECEWGDHYAPATAAVYWTDDTTTSSGLRNVCLACAVEAAEDAVSKSAPGMRVEAEVGFAAVSAELPLAVAA